MQQLLRESAKKGTVTLQGRPQTLREDAARSLYFSKNPTPYSFQAPACVRYSQTKTAHRSLPKGTAGAQLSGHILSPSL